MQNILLKKILHIVQSGNEYIHRGGIYSNRRGASSRYAQSGEATQVDTFRIVLYVIPRDNWTPAYDEQSTYTDKNGDTATIPQGFSVSRKPNEKTVDNGLVVKAPDESEFVWIPVETVLADSEIEGTTNKAMAVKQGENYRGLMYEFDGGNSKVIEGCTTTTTSFREPDIVENDTEFYSSWFTKESLQQDYNGMIESILKYHGFYVGRYELGVEDTEPVSKNAANNSNVTTASADNTETKMWYGLYSKCKEFSTKISDSNIVSSMIWNSQSDAMFNWLTKQGEIVGEGNVVKHNDEYITGKNNIDIVKNIYDLYGCTTEWTLGANGVNYRVARGSRIYFKPSYYNYDAPNNEYGNVGTRITLYIK